MYENDFCFCQVASTRQRNKVERSGYKFPTGLAPLAKCIFYND